MSIMSLLEEFEPCIHSCIRDTGIISLSDVEDNNDDGDGDATFVQISVSCCPFLHRTYSEFDFAASVYRTDCVSHCPYQLIGVPF